MEEAIFQILNEREKRVIDLIADGETLTAIGKRFNVSRDCIARIRDNARKIIKARLKIQDFLVDN